MKEYAENYQQKVGLKIEKLCERVTCIRCMLGALTTSVTLCLLCQKNMKKWLIVEA